MLDLVAFGLGCYEQCFVPPLRRVGIEKAYELVVLEDEDTEYQTIGPASKMLNVIVRTHRDGPFSEAWKQHAIKRQDIMWVAKGGITVGLADGSQTWDLAFIAQALVETGLAELEENKESVSKILEWLDQAQIRDNPKHYGRSYKRITKGAWSFRCVKSDHVSFHKLINEVDVQHKRTRLYRERLYSGRPRRRYISSASHKV
jgi:lanosterol synthase